MTLFRFNHVREKSSDEVPLADDVDVENLAEGFWCGFEDGVGYSYASVIDEDAWFTDFRADPVGNIGNLLRGGDITLIERDIRIFIVEVSRGTCR